MISVLASSGCSNPMRPTFHHPDPGRGLMSITSGTRRSSCCCETTNSRNPCTMVFVQEISHNFNFKSCISSRPPLEQAFILNLNTRTIDTVSPRLVCSFCLAQPLPPLELVLAQSEKSSRLMDPTVSLTICHLDRIFIFEIYAPKLTRDLL